MGLILLEALLALCIFILIVWWTMFSGRNKGELPASTSALEPSPTKDLTPGAGVPASGETSTELHPPSSTADGKNP